MNTLGIVAAALAAIAWAGAVTAAPEIDREAYDRVVS
jgi:drug/metabolite transporter (DMT)-like permease